MYRMAKSPKNCETIQCMRKRVNGNGDHIKQSDLFYDKSDGKYYNNMREMGFHRDCRIYYDEYRSYLRSTLKDRSSHTVFLAELADKTAYIKSPRLQDSDAPGQSSSLSWQRPGHTPGTPHYSGILVSAGIEEIAPPPIVRLYSEAEMTHASTLAETMNSPARYNAFRRIGYEDLSDAGYPGIRAPLIKATEFDDRQHVMARYSSSQKSSSEKTKDAFMSGRLLAAKHRQQYENLNGIPEDTRNVFEEGIIDEVIAEISAGDMAATENAGQQSERDVIKGEIKTTAVEVLQRADSETAGAEVTRQNSNQRTLQSILMGFKKGYLAVSQGWIAQKLRLAERENAPALEVSYGGSTGDMTSPHTPRTPQRQYDLIQSTFFWLPGVSSLGNAAAILSFFEAQKYKLKPGGIIRFVGFSDNGTESKENWQEKQNQYEKAADWVCEHLKRRTYYTDVRKTLLLQHTQDGMEGRPYSEELSAHGLNPEINNTPQYRPLWTDTNKIVGAGGRKSSNLILQARKRRTFRL